MGGRHDSTCLSFQYKFGVDALAPFDNVSPHDGFYTKDFGLLVLFSHSVVG